MPDVRPRAGAWIETSASTSLDLASRFAPARGRGLKHLRPMLLRFCQVRPRAGAWIETRCHGFRKCLSRFAPARGRGLKHVASLATTRDAPFAPARGRGLKHLSARLQRLDRGSPPRGGVD